MNSKMTFAATSLLLAGVLAVSYGCASSSEEDNGGSGGNSSTSGGGAGNSGGGGGGSSTSSTPTASGDSVTFSGGKAEGLFTGYGWVALGADDFITDPTCDTAKAAITKAAPCNTQTNWKDGGTGKLCMSGKIPALGTPPNYTANWGVQIGVNAQEPNAQVGDAMKGYQTVTFTISGEPKSGLRAMLHRAGDADDVSYCLDSIKSGTALTLTKFNTKCWGEADTVKLTADDLPKIDKLGVQVSSGGSEIEVKDLCLEKVEFAK